MNSIKNSKKLIRKTLRNMPELPFEIPFFARRTPVIPYVLGGIGVALMGAIAAVMIFSPRTRYRALGVAKDAYGKVQGKLDSMGVHVGMNNVAENGMRTSESSYSTSGI
ncbi:MAG TPA: hypothetical protein VIF62_13470 [Labilithrix sp.]